MSHTTPYDAANAADPETHTWGFFSYDPDLSAGVFLWFESPEALLRGVRAGEVALYCEGDDEGAAAIEAKVDALLGRLAAGEDAKAVLEDLDDACEAEVTWAGEFEDLKTVEGWSAELRSAYRDLEDADGDPGPVPADEHAAFVEFVRAYAVG